MSTCLVVPNDSNGANEDSSSDRSPTVLFAHAQQLSENERALTALGRLFCRGAIRPTVT
jgi:hypothetical protein